MTESGNHGGASEDETNSVLAVFLHGQLFRIWKQAA